MNDRRQKPDSHEDQSGEHGGRGQGQGQGQGGSSGSESVREEQRGEYDPDKFDKVVPHDREDGHEGRG
jgi:hypothetical protein